MFCQCSPKSSLNKGNYCWDSLDIAIHIGLYYVIETTVSVPFSFRFVWEDISDNFVKNTLLCIKFFNPSLVYGNVKKQCFLIHVCLKHLINIDITYQFLRNLLPSVWSTCFVWCPMQRAFLDWAIVLNRDSLHVHVV